MSGGEELARVAIEGNMMDRVEALETKVESIINGNVRSGSLDMLVEDTDLVGYRIIAVPEGATQLEPTASDFTGAFLAGLEQIMNDLTQDAWLAKINAGEVEFSVGIEGIYQNRLTDGYKHIADDGTTFRAGYLGMSALEGRSAPSWGLSYIENQGGTEKITNGDFETGDLTGWTTVSGSPSVLSDSIMDGKEGTYYVKLSSAVISQTFDVAANSLLFVSYLSQASGVAPIGCVVYLDYYSSTGGGGSLLKSESYESSTIVTQLRNLTIFTPTGSASVKVRLADANPFAMFDSFSVLDFGAGAYNYFGFEPVKGKLISRMLDNADRKYGQLPVGSMSVLRMEEARDQFTATQGAAGNVNVGNHFMLVTYVDTYGETDASLTYPVAASVTASAKTVALTNIPLGKWGTTARKIYATIAGSAASSPADFYLVQTISDNTTTTGTYNISDANLVLNAQLPTVNTTASRPVWPRSAFIMPQTVITTVTLAEQLSAAYRSGFYLNPTAANANLNDKYTFSFMAEAGTYTLTHIGRTANSLGLPRYYIDGVSVGTLDWYSAGAVDYVTKTISSISITTSGYHILEIVVDAKNGASSDYIVAFSELYLVQAAY